MLPLFNKEKSLAALLAVSAAVFLVVYFLDRSLFFGLAMILFLITATFFIFYISRIRSKSLYVLFLITLGIHMAMVLFSHYAHFAPFGEGDFVLYQNTAQLLAERLNSGIFSLEGLWVPHYYPVFIGIIYALTLPSVLIGNLFSAYLAALSVSLVFLLTKEISPSKHWPFAVGLMVAIMPSYLFFGSLLLKDTAVIPLVLAGLLVSLKIYKHFSWWKFAIFFMVLTAAIHLRFYVGFALLFSFIVSWFLISNLRGKEKVGYGLIMIFVLGFAPQLLSYGYYGTTPLKGYLNEKTITSYREVVYAPNPVATPSPLPTAVAVPPPAPSPTPAPNPVLTQPPLTVTPVEDQPKKKYCEECPLEDQGVGSSFVIGAGFDNPFKFAFNYFVSFIFSLLGPFPWQIRHARQAFSLLETIPWYVIVCVFIYGLARFLKTSGVRATLQRYRLGAPLFLFAIMSLGALSLFINNFGIITRIRMPSLIVLLCLISFDQWSSDTLKKIYEKITIIVNRLPFLQK